MLDYSYRTICNRQYQDGFRNGWLDAKLGIYLTISLYSNLSGYSQGYYDGQLAFKNGEPLEV